MKNKTIKELLEFSVINIDKPRGPTSFSVSDYVRKRLRELQEKYNANVKKTSHFGTLDPNVTGVLPIAIGRACRLTGFFIGHYKTYIGVIHVNNKINTGKLQEIINKNFKGKIKQTPPIKSRVKREERERHVREWKLLEADETGNKFLFRADVEGGTYIRKLCSDLGEHIGGAHMLELRRIKAGIFTECNLKDKKCKFPLIKLYEFDKAIEQAKKGNDNMLRNILIPAEQAVKDIMLYFELDNDNRLNQLLTGKQLFKQDFEENNINKLENLKNKENFALFCKNRFIGIYEHNDNIIGRALFVLN